MKKSNKIFLGIVLIIVGFIIFTIIKALVSLLLFLLFVGAGITMFAIGLSTPDIGTGVIILRARHFGGMYGNGFECPIAQSVKESHPQYKHIYAMPDYLIIGHSKTKAKTYPFEKYGADLHKEDVKKIKEKKLIDGDIVRIIRFK